MYGYIRVHAPELKVREQEYYRAVYCGLCRTMGKCTGQCSRLTLSYDFTFFALVRLALTGETVTVRRRACVAHPFRRHPMIEPNETLALCAFLSAIMAYHKLSDDRRDERGGKHALTVLLSPYMKSLRRRALKRDYEAADRAVSASMDALCRLESARPPSVDEPAEIFGRLLGTLLSAGLENPEKKIAEVIGRHMGRWVYIVDAADDFAEDIRKGRYNPFACLYADETGTCTLTELPAHKKEEIRTALLGELMEIENAFDLMDLDDPDHPDLGGILHNVLYMGMPREAERVLFGDTDTPTDTDVESLGCAGNHKKRKRKRKPKELTDYR